LKEGSIDQTDENLVRSKREFVFSTLASIPLKYIEDKKSRAELACLAKNTMKDLLAGEYIEKPELIGDIAKLYLNYTLPNEESRPRTSLLTPLETFSLSIQQLERDYSDLELDFTDTPQYQQFRQEYDKKFI
jgi:hypothetical protein